jgi:hypothetical protein
MFMETRSGIRRLVLLIILPVAFGFFCAGQSSPGVSGLHSYLPSVEEAGVWKTDGAPQEFKGEDLYLYIDGGAEIYREYGFAEVLVQEYRNREGKGLSLEIFRMTSPESAYGMFTFKRSARGIPVEAGAEGQLEDYYLNFWKGDFLVTITGPDGSPATLRGLLALARAVAAKMQGESRRAQLAAELPLPGLVKTSVRYFKGFLGFMNNYPSLGKEAFRFQEGVRGDYGSDVSIFVLKYASEGELRGGFPEIERTLKNDPKAREFKSGGGLSFQVIDDRGKLVSLEVAKDLLLLCIEDKVSGEHARGLFEKIRNSR